MELGGEQGKPSSGSERSVELMVRYERMNTFFADYATNISKGGTFLATEEPLPADSVFHFALAVPELAEPLSFRAKVLSSTTTDEQNADNPAGMRIEFEYESEASRASVETTIEQLMVAHLGVRHVAALLARPPRQASALLAMDEPFSQP